MTINKDTRAYITGFVLGPQSADVRTSRDWFSGHAQAARMQSSMSRPPTCRCIVFALFCFRARLARKYECSNPRVDFYIMPSRITFVNCLNFSSEYWCPGFEPPSNAGACGFELPVWQFVNFWSTYGVAFAPHLTFFMQRILSPLF